ncbi:hypothetical protein F5Y03DRAFT_265553 [Xylaria venustula]|nr:hypothetical protein F5Y03DRAFT_265553 [Xylaria venustula]
MKLDRVLFCTLIVASSSHAGPTPILDLSPVGSPDTELLVREGIKFARSQDIEKRASADFSLEKSWDNEVLFGGAWNDTSPDKTGAENAELSVICLSCYTHGTVTAQVTDEHFLKPRLRLGFSGVEAYASLGVRASAGQTFSLNLFASDSPIGIGISGLDVGVVFFVDLVFSLSEAIDLTAGFQVSVPDDAYLEADIFEGDIDDSAFDGISSQSLPVTVISGTATFKADLRLRVQAGAEASIDLFDIGAGAVIGIYANIIEFVAVIEKTPTCDVETEISWDLNVGAYAHLDVVVDYTTLGPVPTVSTTLFAGETISSCWVEPTTMPALPATTSEIVISSSPLALSSSSIKPGGIKATTSAETTSIISTDPTLVWSPTFVLSVTAPEVTFSIPNISPTDAASSLPSPSTSAPPPTTATVSSLPPSSSSQGASSSAGSVSSVYYPSSIATSSYSYGVGSSGSVSSAHYPSSVAASSYSYAAVTYPFSVPSKYSTSALASAGPTYTSTYTYVMTRCGAAGVMNCPATYQTEIAVTRTTTICPATATTTPTTIASTGVTELPIPTISSKPAGSNQTSGETVVIILTPLPTPIVATFVAPAETSTAHVEGLNGTIENSSIVTITTTSTTTITTTSSHDSVQVPTPLTATSPSASPNPSLSSNPSTNVAGNTTVAGTGLILGATPSGGAPSSSQTPVIAGAGRLSGSNWSIGAAAPFAIALFLCVV